MATAPKRPIRNRPGRAPARRRTGPPAFQFRTRATLPPLHSIESNAAHTERRSESSAPRLAALRYLSVWRHDHRDGAFTWRRDRTNGPGPSRAASAAEDCSPTASGEGTDTEASPECSDAVEAPRPHQVSHPSPSKASPRTASGKSWGGVCTAMTSPQGERLLAAGRRSMSPLAGTVSSWITSFAGWRSTRC
jgi:hypothetical protein